MDGHFKSYEEELIEPFLDLIDEDNEDFTSNSNSEKTSNKEKNNEFYKKDYSCFF